MTTAKELATRILADPPFSSALVDISADRMAIVLNHTIEIIEAAREGLSFVPDVLARTDMGNMPLRRTLIKEALLAGFQLALDQSELLSMTDGKAVH